MKKTHYNIKVKTSYSNTRWFITQKDCSNWLGVQNSSKKSIESRCRVLGYEVEFDA